MERKKRILIAPLDWGIGHATRCIPIIKELINNHFEVIIAADGRPLHLLVREFPKLKAIRFHGYNIPCYESKVKVNLVKSMSAYLHARR